MTKRVDLACWSLSRRQKPTPRRLSCSREMSQYLQVVSTCHRLADSPVPFPSPGLRFSAKLKPVVQPLGEQCRLHEQTTPCNRRLGAGPPPSSRGCDPAWLLRHLCSDVAQTACRGCTVLSHAARTWCYGGLGFRSAAADRLPAATSRLSVPQGNAGAQQGRSAIGKPGRGLARIAGPLYASASRDFMRASLRGPLFRITCVLFFVSSVTSVFFLLFGSNGLEREGFEWTRNRKPSTLSSRRLQIAIGVQTPATRSRSPKRNKPRPKP